MLIIMGYRHYLAKIKKEKALHLQDMSYETFMNTYGDKDIYEELMVPGPYNLPYVERIHELGKYVDMDIINTLKGDNPESLFSDLELVKDYDEFDLYLVEKEGLIGLIDIYQEKVRKNYENMFKFTEEDQFRYGKDADLSSKHERFFEERIDMWSRKYVMDNDESNPYNICHALDYEYQIFNLLHILKMINWEEEQLIIYGF